MRCVICGVEFERWRKGGKPPVMCEACYTPENLKIHARTVHRDYYRNRIRTEQWLNCPVCNERKIVHSSRYIVCLDCMHTPEGEKYRTQHYNQGNSDLKRRKRHEENVVKYKRAGLVYERARATYTQLIRCELCGKDSLVMRSVQHLCNECRPTPEGRRYMLELGKKRCAERRGKHVVGGRLIDLSKPEIIGVHPSAPEDVLEEYPLLRGSKLPEPSGWRDFEFYVFRQGDMVFANLSGQKVPL